jgi:hypothetical protein
MGSFRVQTLDRQPETETVPHICFKFRISFQESYKMLRLQFPLRLAYSMTYHKCQGQTMKRVLLDISNPPFAHGHLYVALSRVTNYQDIKIMATLINSLKIPQLLIMSLPLIDKLIVNLTLGSMILDRVTSTSHIS